MVWKDGERDDVHGAVRMEHGGAVTYIIYVRQCIYRLFATIYIVYLSARTDCSPSRLQQPHRPAPRRLRPPPCQSVRAGTRDAFGGPDRAACAGRFVLRSSWEPLASLKLIRGWRRIFLCTTPTQYMPASRRCPRRSKPPSVRCCRVCRRDVSHMISLIKMYPA